MENNNFRKFSLTEAFYTLSRFNVHSKIYIVYIILFGFMGARPDFVVRYDPYSDTNDMVVNRILYALFIRPLKFKKPTIIFLSGDSGEGKSWSGLSLMYVLLQLQGVDMRAVNKDVNIHTPLEYPQKLSKILTPKKHISDPELLKIYKKTNVLCIHEARTLIKSKRWQDFVSQAVADVNAMSRAIKRICFIIISQFIRDITTDVRYTLNYYAKSERHYKEGGARLFLNRMWKDDRDLEKPKLRKAKIWGFLVSPNGRYKKFVPDYFKLSRPPKEITQEFDQNDYESKGKIIHSIMERMVKQLEMDFTTGNSKINAMVQWYSKNVDHLRSVGHVTKTGRWRFKPEITKMHDLTPSEFKEFQDMFNKEMTVKRLIKVRE